MNFREATDGLLASATLEDLATEMGVSVQAVRQARAGETTSSARPPPPHWERAVGKLARRMAAHFERLGNAMKLPVPNAERPVTGKQHKRAKKLPKGRHRGAVD